MQLKQLFEGVAYTGTLPEADAVLVTQDSRRAAPGAVFVCAKGTATDGHLWAQKALEAGAVCIVTERPLGLPGEVTVSNGRQAYAILCQNFFGVPARNMQLVAVTGTNGKTTVTTLIKQILEQAGFKAGLIGTIHTEIDTMEIPAKFTTPEAWDLAALMARMYKAGCTHVVMEASSQALDQMRLWGLHFAVGVFTNLTQDHLDYHKTFENYYLAKRSLFAQVEHMVVNVDDAYGRRLLAEAHTPCVTTYSVEDAQTNLHAQDVQLSASGVAFELVGKMQNGSFARRVNFPMPGAYSVHNALAAAGAALALGLQPSTVVQALAASRGVRGRCEVLHNGAFTVICDFAHTGDAIDKLLGGLAPFCKGRLVALFGCAGERDAKKRPLMAQAVVRYADFVVLTSDNPRREDPYAIIEEVEPTLAASGKPYLVEVERRAAVRKALSLLQPGDVLALCGKGHEDYQVIDGVTLYLDEHRIVREWLAQQGL
jgi:UDP-N-acetylmuramoyl-L-alanyl-D-glutamate--2,6-diaminopimelate ligase